jgi:hypothetical protein
MKKILLILNLLILLTACGNRELIESRVEYTGTITVESKRDEQVAVFKKSDGELLNLFWEDEPENLEIGATYDVQYHLNDNYTDYKTLLHFEKIE